MMTPVTVYGSIENSRHDSQESMDSFMGEFEVVDSPTAQPHEEPRSKSLQSQEASSRQMCKDKARSRRLPPLPRPSENSFPKTRGQNAGDAWGSSSPTAAHQRRPHELMSWGQRVSKVAFGSSGQQSGFAPLNISSSLSLESLDTLSSGRLSPEQSQDVFPLGAPLQTLFRQPSANSLTGDVQQSTLPSLAYAQYFASGRPEHPNPLHEISRAHSQLESEQASSQFRDVYHHPASMIGDNLSTSSSLPFAAAHNDIDAESTKDQIGSDIRLGSSGTVGLNQYDSNGAEPQSSDPDLIRFDDSELSERCSAQQPFETGESDRAGTVQQNAAIDFADIENQRAMQGSAQDAAALQNASDSKIARQPNTLTQGILPVLDSPFRTMAHTRVDVSYSDSSADQQSSSPKSSSDYGSCTKSDKEALSGVFPQNLSQIFYVDGNQPRLHLRKRDFESELLTRLLDTSNRKDVNYPAYPHKANFQPEISRGVLGAVGLPKTAFLALIFMFLACFLIVFSAGRLHSQKMVLARAEIMEPSSLDADGNPLTNSLLSHADVSLGNPEHYKLAGIQTLIDRHQAKNSEQDDEDYSMKDVSDSITADLGIETTAKQHSRHSPDSGIQNDRKRTFVGLRLHAFSAF